VVKICKILDGGLQYKLDLLGEKRIYPKGKHKNFLFFTQLFFANFEFIFAIRDLKLARRDFSFLKTNGNHCIKERTSNNRAGRLVRMKRKNKKVKKQQAQECAIKTKASNRISNYQGWYDSK